MDLTGWTPIRIQWNGPEPLVEWCYTGETTFTDPFFDQTVEWCLRRPFSLLFRHLTGMDALIEPGTVRPPSGFVLHMSRCGSTLVAQMLAAVPGTVVMSEAGPVDSILRAGERVPNLTDEQHVEWLRAIVGGLGRQRQPGSHYVLKLDAWNTVQLGVLRRAFPEVPWIFVYRDPLEVMVSQMRQSGADFVPGVLAPEHIGLTPADLMMLRPEDYCARVLARIASSVLDHIDDPNGMLVSYDELPRAMFELILPWFGITPSGEDRERMTVAASVDAKNPGTDFKPDGTDKRTRAGAAVVASTERWLRPIHERLEEARDRHRLARAV
jgi:gluconate kinase